MAILLLHFTSAFFVRKSFAQLLSSSFWFCIFWQKDISKKSAQKMLMKLTIALTPKPNFACFVTNQVTYHQSNIRPFYSLIA